MNSYQVVIPQWLARRLATWVVPGSNPGKGVLLILNKKERFIGIGIVTYMDLSTPQRFKRSREKCSPNEELKALNQALELHSRAAPSVEAHHCVNGSDTVRKSGGRRIIKKVLRRYLFNISLECF